MKRTLRSGFPVLLGICLFASSSSLYAHALSPAPPSSIDEPVNSTAMLTEMEAKAAQAEPRERCFLYTELLHEWTEVAGRSLAAGDELAAGTAMQHADANAQSLKLALSRDSKRLKTAELLMAHSVHRLSDMLRVSTLEQRESLQTVLKHVSNVHDDLLAAVFAH